MSANWTPTVSPKLLSARSTADAIPADNTRSSTTARARSNCRKETSSSRAPGRLIVDIDAAGGGFFLRLKATNPQDPLRQHPRVPAGHRKTDCLRTRGGQGFLDQWRGMACLRFMDLQLTNNSTQKVWSDRPRIDDATWTRAGVPIEVLCDLANRLQADAWFCIPHQADDNYVREFARLVRKSLDNRRRVYVEYSNEVWNGQFQQQRYAAEQGKRLGFAEKDWEAAWRYTSLRSVEIFRIWEDEFGARDRLVRVLPSQAANAYVSEQIVGWEEAYRHADVLAIAPYISFNIPEQGEGLTAETVAAWPVGAFLDHLEQSALPEAIGWMQANLKVAQAHQLQLVCYEAGQHLVGVAGGENNERLTALLHQANAHPRMAQIYTEYYQAWEKLGGDLLCHFSSIGNWSKWGSWGLLQYYDDDPAKSPKAQATLQWAKHLGAGKQ